MATAPIPAPVSGTAAIRKHKTAPAASPLARTQLSAQAVEVPTGKSWVMTGANGKTPATPSSIPALVSGIRAIPKPPPILQALRPTVPPRRLVRRAAMKSHPLTITMIGMRGNPMEMERIPIPAKTTAVIQKPQIVPVVPPPVRRRQSATSAIWCMASLHPIH